jgi:hypothetical protein
MKKEIFYKKQRINKFNGIVRKYSKSEFNSPYRSTIPLLLLFNNKEWVNFSLISSQDVCVIEYIFEHETSVIKGKGRASCTDLMIISDDSCISVEAKRTEPPYETVLKWLGNSVNKELVLSGWLEMIKAKTKKKLI